MCVWILVAFSYLGITLWLKNFTLRKLFNKEAELQLLKNVERLMFCTSLAMRERQIAI